MVIVFALAAAVLYGSADFLGGAASRRLRASSVLTVSAPVGAAVLLLAALLAGGSPALAGIPWAAELWHWTVQPGEGWGGDAHMPATRELIWVESGTLTLTVAGASYQAGAGQSARFSAGLPHSYRNDGTEPVVMTMIVVVPPAPS